MWPSFKKSEALQGLLNKRPEARLSWPELLHHPFVRESDEEVQRRQAALADAQAASKDTRGWRGEECESPGAFNTLPVAITPLTAADMKYADVAVGFVQALIACNRMVCFGKTWRQRCHSLPCVRALT